MDLYTVLMCYALLSRINYVVINFDINYLTIQFDQICKEYNIILIYISIYLLYLLQLFDIDYFISLKYMYNRFVKDLIQKDINYINKLDFFIKQFFSRLYIYSTIQRKTTISADFLGQDTI
ncbi:hypothetical protein VI817_008944 [Penicillium citrinum]|nr:hypothetical protein VI817_008944 [Penicillium citrinum]